MTDTKRGARSLVANLWATPPELTRRSCAKNCLVLAGLISLSFACHDASAWGPAGHQTIGAIADELLRGTNAAQHVQQLLNGHTLSEVSVWADCAKGVDKNFKYANDDQKYPECKSFEAEAADFEAYVKNNWAQCGTVHDNEQCHKQYHYADISTFEHQYSDVLVGANSHDVVHAIDAAVAKLRGQPVPPPFWFKDDRQALMLLAHYVGDVHQPLHVTAIYLDSTGARYNPDDLGYKKDDDTAGANLITDDSNGRLLHSEWDAVPDTDSPGGANTDALVSTAKQTHPTEGDVKTWAGAWATDTIQLQATSFGGLKFTVDPKGHGWRVTGIDDSYTSRVADTKFRQLAKAGARLTQLLQGIWPEPLMLTAGSCDDIKSGYLDKAPAPDITAWLPPPPARGSAAEEADIDAYLSTRTWLTKGNPRGEQAALDDVYDPALVLQRFQAAGAGQLTAAQTKALVVLLCKVERDADRTVAPIKLKTRQGARLRPFVTYPENASCLAPIDMAGHAKEDMGYLLPASGSYPSGHALLGMLVGLILSDVSPDHADELIARGIDFGESRLICGFHYPSDLVAGRLTATVLFSALKRDATFQADLGNIARPPP